MDRASSLIFPGSRTLAGWWRQLAPYQPTSIWLGYGYLHRIEASLNVLTSKPLDPLSHLILQAVDVEQSTRAGRGSEAHFSALVERLRLPHAIVRQLLCGMQSEGLLDQDQTACWHATESGRNALQSRQIPYRAVERRVFSFLERLDPTGQRAAEPHFVPLGECPSVPWQVHTAFQFNVEALDRCLTQSADWKHAHAFPAEVEARADGDTREAWERVIVDRPERVMLVLILSTRSGGPEILGFPVKVDGWTLNDQSPRLRLPAAGRSIWPEMTMEVSSEVWQAAWRSWCRERQLPSNEVEICGLTHRPPRLEVQAPPRLLQRLQAAKSDLFRGDAWLIVGDGYFRTAAQLVMRP